MHVQGGRPVPRQFSRATQTATSQTAAGGGGGGDSVDRPLPYVVVTAPSPQDGDPRRPHEPTVLRARPRLSAVSYTPDSASPPPNHVEVAARGGQGQVPAAGSDEVRRRTEEAEVQALLRDLGVEPSSV